MRAKISKNVVQLSELKSSPGKVVSRTQETHSPVLLTSRDRGVAVVQGLENFERAAEELKFAKAVAQGLSDARAGNTVSLAETKQQVCRAADVDIKAFANHSAGLIEGWTDADEDEVWT